MGLEQELNIPKSTVHRWMSPSHTVGLELWGQHRDGLYRAKVSIPHGGLGTMVRTARWDKVRHLVSPSHTVGSEQKLG